MCVRVVVSLAVSLVGTATALTSLGACTSGAGSPAPTTRTVVRTVVDSPSAPVVPPISTGPTKAAAAAKCPYADEQSTANRVGMRLARITVLRSGGRVVGCRFYALQGSPLSTSEHLPGPHQPAVEIETFRYPSDVSAHNAFVRASERGRNVQQASIVGQAPGLCFQINFFAEDHGTDWACSFSKGKAMAIVRTVVTSPALNAVAVARAVASKL